MSISMKLLFFKLKFSFTKNICLQYVLSLVMPINHPRHGSSIIYNSAFSEFFVWKEYPAFP